MSLQVTNPVVKKFLDNKLRGTSASWEDELLGIASTFSALDGQIYNRGTIIQAFSRVETRPSSELTDSRAWRNFFASYGTCLGMFYVDHSNGFRCRLSDAARFLLCSSEPDVQAFLRVQLALFQYPYGRGITYRETATGAVPSRVVSNFLDDTVREVSAGVRIVPVRVLAKALLHIAQREASNAPFLSYAEIYYLFNQPTVYHNPNCDVRSPVNVILEARHDGAHISPVPTNFKRNFHVLERTGLFERTGEGLVAPLNETGVRVALTAIASMRNFFGLLNRQTNERQIEQAILSGRWGRYYDGLRQIPFDIVSRIIGDPSLEEPLVQSLAATADGEIESPTFSTFRAYREQQPATLSVAQTTADPEETRIARERRNNSHRHLTNALSQRLTQMQFNVLNNNRVDLVSESEGARIFFEVKTSDTRTVRAQVRRGVGQLLEYRFLSRGSNHEPTILCLVLEHEPSGGNSWLVEYVTSIGIEVIWFNQARPSGFAGRSSNNIIQTILT
jgi:hypothetical protein